MQNANLPEQLFRKKARSRLGCLGQLLVLGLILVGVGLLLVTDRLSWLNTRFQFMADWISSEMLVRSLARRRARVDRLIETRAAASLALRPPWPI